MVFLANILLKKVKSKRIMVQLQSAISGHTFNMFRDRLADKMELIRFDPYVQTMVVYREKKKIRSV